MSKKRKKQKKSLFKEEWDYTKVRYPESRAERMFRQNELIQAVMQEMVNRDFSVGEAEAFPDAFKEALQRNSERFEKQKPFAIFEYPYKNEVEKEVDKITEKLNEITKKF